MITVIVSGIIAVVALVAGGYLGYRYGRSVEAKAQALIAQASAKAGAVAAAVKQ